MQGKTFIYALVDPITERVRYIGKSDNPKKRMNSHLTDTRYSKHKVNWIQKLKRQGLVPLLLIIEEVDVSLWKERERYWIAFYRQQQLDLINETDGGEGMNGWEITPETRAKRSKALTGKKRTPEQIATLVERARERAINPVWRAKVSENARKRRLTPQERAKISASKKALYANDPGLRARISESHKGIRLSEATRAKKSETMRAKYEAGWDIGEEARAKISASKRGKPRSDEVKAKLSAAKQGKKLKPLSEEHKAKLSEAKRGKLNPKLSEAKRGKPTGRPRCDACGRFLSKANECPVCSK